MLQLLFVLLLPLTMPQSSTPAPAPHVIRELKVDDAALLNLIKGNIFELPQLRIYDRQGRQVADFGGGFNPNRFRGQLEEVLRSPSPKEGKKSLQTELQSIVEKDGKPVEKISAADFTMVEYWAEWCKPCHLQAKDMNEVIEKHPDLTITVLHVEADPEKITGIKMKKGK
jgi:hypothetical protein